MRKEKQDKGEKDRTCPNGQISHKPPSDYVKQTINAPHCVCLIPLAAEPH